MGKTDSTGTYTSLCDGTSPGSPLLSDGAAVYTPGLSERRGGASTFYSNDKQGNLWTLNAANGGQTLYQDTTAFGTPTASAYSSLTPFKFGGGNGCQSDIDTGLVLMGHRYYDTRIGRFITQDPAGSGNNWYAYAGNNPVNAMDPSGLSIINQGAAPSPSDSRFGNDPGGLFGGSGILDDLFAAENASSERGRQGYLLSLAQASHRRYHHVQMESNRGQSVNLGLGLVFDFFRGKGKTVRNYGSNSTQVQTFLDSMSGKDVLEQLAAQDYSGNASGGVGHVLAFVYGIGDFTNRSQGHMGAFDWHVESQINGYDNIVVHNDITRASFLGGNTFGFHVNNPTSGPQRTITEYYRFSVKIP